MIPEKILQNYGAVAKSYHSGEIIYSVGSNPNFYFQIISGSVKLNNISDEGKEFIHFIFDDSQCFGEALIFLEEPSPVNAIVLSDCQFYKLSKEKFIQLLKDYPEFSLEINKNLAQRVYYKLLLTQKILSKNPAARIKVLLDYFKNSKNPNLIQGEYQFPLTRQQIADLTGLRVETVIRTIKAMEKKEILTIRDRKIFY